MSRPKRNSIARIHSLLIVPFALALISLSACNGSDDDSTENATAAPATVTASNNWRTGGYVNDNDCTGCHREIAQSFTTTVAMARTLMPADGAPLIEDLDQPFYHALSRNHYQMRREGDRYILRRWQVAGDDGAPINILEQPIDYLIGSGNHVRVYAYKTPSDELFQMPIVWFAHKKEWVMAPGFDRPDHFDFTRHVQRDCIFCHNPDPGFGDTGDRYGEPYIYPHDFSTGIGCQRCHGPGTRHVELGYDQTASIDAIRASIVNPANLSPRLSDDVCLQCHLQPTSERTSIVRRLDHGDFSFRPGEALADHIIHIDFRDEAAQGERFEANHHGYRMMQSPCFTGSDGALQCITCHDPHHKPPLEAKHAQFRAACLTCHAPDSCTVTPETLTAHSHIAADECITCHMPARPPGDAPHVLLTDHRIGIYPIGELGAVESFPASAAQDHSVAIFGRSEAELTTDDRIYLALAAIKSGYPYEADEFAAIVTESSGAASESRDANLYLADLHREAGNFDEAKRAYEIVLSSDPDMAYAHQGLGTVFLQSGDGGGAIEHFRAAVETSPESPDARELLATALMHGGGEAAIDEAIENYKEAIRLRPLFAAAHFNLASAYVTRQSPGDLDRAIAHYQQAAAIDPAETRAYRRAGELLRATNKVPEALRLWRHGFDMSPPQNESHLDLAILLAETYLTAPSPEHRNPAEGLRYAEICCELDETRPYPMLLQGFAFLVTDWPTEAEEAARQALFRATASGDDRHSRPPQRVNSGGNPADYSTIDATLLLALAAHTSGDTRQGAMLYQQTLSLPDFPAAAAQPTPLRSALLALTQRAFGG